MTNNFGGRREGAGRPRGRKNDKTLAIEEAVKEATSKVIKRLSLEEVKSRNPAEMLVLIAEEAYLAGDLRAAQAAYRDAAPYIVAKKAVIVDVPQFPSELMPDPPSSPDEPGPPSGVIE